MSIIYPIPRAVPETTRAYRKDKTSVMLSVKDKVGACMISYDPLPRTAQPDEDRIAPFAGERPGNTSFSSISRGMWMKTE